MKAGGSVGLLRLSLLVVAVFSAATGVSWVGNGNLAWAEVSENRSLDEKTQQLKTVLDEVDLQNIPNASLLKSAQLAFSTGDEELGNRYLVEFIESNQKVLASITDPGTARLDSKEALRYAIATSPEGVKKGFRTVALSMAKSAFTVQEATMTAKLTTLNTVGRKLAVINTERQKRAAGILAEALSRLAEGVTHGDTNLLLSFAERKRDLFYRYDQAIQALGNRWETAEDRARDIADSIESFLRTGKFYLDSKEELRVLRDFNEREKNQEILYEVVLTKENVSVAVAAAAATAELVCAAATMGLCLAATPGLIGTVTTAVRTASSVYAGTLAAADLSDNYRFGGVQGLLSISSAIDVFVIFIALPRPSVDLMKWAPELKIGPQWLQQGVSKLQLFRGVAQAQHQAGYILLATGVGYGLWQVTHAEQVSKDLEKLGKHLTPNEVRQRGMLSVALGMLGGLKAFHEYKVGVRQGGEEYKELMRPGTSGPVFQRLGQRFSKLLPWNPPVSMVKNVAHFSEAPWMNSLNLAGNAAMLGYNLLFYSSLYWMSYSYMDFNFESRSQDLPVLGPGEIALTLNGIAPDDLLYYAFKSNVSKREELKVYQENENFFDDDFTTPDEFVLKLKTYAKKYGKIKYLRVTAHGLPGRFYAAAEDFSGAGGDHIGVEYIRQHERRIREVSREAFAPSAQIRLVSCLVGANLDQPMDYKPDSTSTDAPEHFEKDAGDQFIRAFGESFLVNGGVVDSSRRVIMGFRNGYGTALNYAMNSIFLDAASKEELKDELEAWKLEVQAVTPRLLLPGENNGRNNENSGLEEAILLKTVKRLKKMYTRLPELVSKFGHNIEGNWFAEKHRKDAFPAQP